MIGAANADLFNSRAHIAAAQPWKPVALANEQWPPDYRGVYLWRVQQLAKLTNDPAALTSARAYYATRPAQFIMHWMDTYNPRLTGSKWVPFVLFERQDEFIEYLTELDRDGENGLVEKCRDIGATWLAAAYSVHCWLYRGDDATGWGSRKQELVDKLGDPDSIFEKMRLLIKRLPKIWLPEGFKPRDHATFMKLTNPETGATITGESGDNIGRGGRKTRYFKDESAHYERPEKIEAALGDNTNVQIDISSVNGLGNVFHRRRESGVEWKRGETMPAGETRVFIFDWRHHPEKDQAWYDRRKAKAEREGMQHIFAQEVDRNYSAAVQNTLISYEWITAAVDAHLTVPCLRVPPPAVHMAALDVGDSEDGDRNALAVRQWIILRSIEEWTAADPGVTTRRAIGALRAYPGIKLQYDGIGVGSGVKSEYNRLCNDGIVTPQLLTLVSWNAGGAVVDPFFNVIPDDPQSLLNKDFYANMKAQAWWSLRTRFYKTWRSITLGEVYPADELISLDSTMPLLHQLMKELATPTKGESTGLRMIVDKKPNGSRSPNLADAVMMAFFPAPEPGGQPVLGAYSG